MLLRLFRLVQFGPDLPLYHVLDDERLESKAHEEIDERQTDDHVPPVVDRRHLQLQPTDHPVGRVQCYVGVEDRQNDDRQDEQLIRVDGLPVGLADGENNGYDGVLKRGYAEDRVVLVAVVQELVLRDERLEPVQLLDGIEGNELENGDDDGVHGEGEQGREADEARGRRLSG